MTTDVSNTSTQTYAEFIDGLADMVFIDFIERGRASLAESAETILEQGYTFLQRAYPAPWPKNAPEIDTLKRNIKIVLLNGLIREGMVGVRNGVLESYQAMAQVAEKYSLAVQQEKTNLPSLEIPESTTIDSQEAVLLCVRTAVADIFKRDIELITLDTNFSNDLSDDILDFVELTMRLEDRLNFAIKDEDAALLKTVRSCVNLACLRLSISVDTTDTK